MRLIDADALKEQYYKRMKELLKATETAETVETVTNTKIPFSYRKTKLTDAKLAIILISVMKEMEPCD